MIKNIFTTALLTVIMFTTAWAQQNNNGKFEFGVTAGYNTATIAVPSNFSYSSQYEHSFNAGVSVEYRLEDDFGIRTSLLYDRKGYSGYPGLEGGPFTITSFRLDYITLPVVANIHFGGKNYSWYINTGPYIGTLISAGDDQSSKLKKDYNPTDFGLAFGCGHQFSLSANNKLFIEFDGQQGLRTIFPGTRYNYYGKFENFCFAFNIGLNFR